MSLSFSCKGITITLQNIMVNMSEVEKKEDGSFVLSPEAFNQDYNIARSARVSTGREDKKGNEGLLINSLYGQRHDTPFEGASVFCFMVETPICFAQPFFQTTATENEISSRYQSESYKKGDFYMPDFLEHERPFVNSPCQLELFFEAQDDSKETYEKLLTLGVAKEQARYALIYSFYTRFYWTISLRHMLELCVMEPHENVPKEFWEATKNILPKFIQQFAPETFAAMKENEGKRIISTQWAENSLLECFPEAYWEKLLNDNSKKYASVETVGKITLLQYSENNEKLFRLGTQTKYNPAHGFGHSLITIAVEDPISVHRQWVRHRYGVWTELPTDFDRVVQNQNFYIPEQFRVQIGKAMEYKFENTLKEQNEVYKNILLQFIVRSSKRYWELRELGLAREYAALVLPYAFRVKNLWSVNLESLMNYFSLRCDTHAQWEIRVFADVIYTWFKELYPGFAVETFKNKLNFGKSKIFSK